MRSPKEPLRRTCTSPGGEAHCLDVVGVDHIHPVAVAADEYELRRTCRAPHIALGFPKAPPPPARSSTLTGTRRGTPSRTQSPPGTVQLAQTRHHPCHHTQPAAQRPSHIIGRPHQSKRTTRNAAPRRAAQRSAQRTRVACPARTCTSTRRTCSPSCSRSPRTPRSAGGTATWNSPTRTPCTRRSAGSCASHKLSSHVHPHCLPLPHLDRHADALATPVSGNGWIWSPAPPSTNPPPLRDRQRSSSDTNVSCTARPQLHNITMQPYNNTAIPTLDHNTMPPCTH